MDVAADGSSAWDAAAAQGNHLTPAQVAQLTPGYSPSPSKDGKGVQRPLPAPRSVSKTSNRVSQAHLTAGDSKLNPRHGSMLRQLTMRFLRLVCVMQLYCRHMHSAAASTTRPRRHSPPTPHGTPPSAPRTFSASATPIPGSTRSALHTRSYPAEDPA